MDVQQLSTLLLGSLGCLVLSLLLNYAFYRGWILNPRVTVPREDYETQVEISVKNTESLELIARRSKTKNAKSRKRD